MIQIQGLDHVVLRTTRLAAMIDFYQRLGCHIEREEARLGLYQLRAGASLIDIVPVEAPLGQEGGPAPGQDGHNMDHFCLTLENFDGDAVLGYILLDCVYHSEETVRGRFAGNSDSIDEEARVNAEVH